MIKCMLQKILPVYKTQTDLIDEVCVNFDPVLSADILQLLNEHKPIMKCTSEQYKDYYHPDNVLDEHEQAFI